MNRRYTTLTSIILLFPFLLFLVILKGSDKSSLGNAENEIKSNIFMTSGGSVNEIAQLVDTVGDGKDQNADEVGQRSGLDCMCNCDKSAPTDKPVVNDLIEERLAIDSKTNSVSDIDSKSTELKSTNPTIFVITPTYSRPTQMADMTRLSQTLSLVKDLFWIVSEDSHQRSSQVSELLSRTNMPFVHLLGPRPVTHLDKRSGRGVSNRLKALEYLRDNYYNSSQEGVIYFADDDNAYDIRIFDEIRHTKKVSMFPVGLIAKLGLSTPIVNNKTAKIIGFHDPFISRRKYAVDMAGFAVNLQLFLSRPRATMPYKVGYEEDYFIRSLGVHFDDLEPKAHNCTQILVWHTKTTSGTAPVYSFMTKHMAFNETNLPLLYENTKTV